MVPLLRRLSPLQRGTAIFLLGACAHHVFVGIVAPPPPGTGGAPPAGRSSLEALSRQRAGAAAPAAGPTRPGGALKEVFASLWGKELLCLLGLEEETAMPPMIFKYSLDEVLASVQGQGVGVIFTSARWKWQQPDPEGYDFRVMDYVQQRVCARGLRLAVVLDGDATPSWVARRFPDGVFRDVLNLTRGSASFNHPGALQLAHAWHDAVLARLAANNASCVHSVQPSWNNEYESKLSQEHDAPQDYGPPAVLAFRQYALALHGGLAHWNARWGTNFSAWEDVAPPKFYQHGFHYNDTMADPFYWDWQHFRHRAVHNAHEHACQRIAARGFKCIMHFPEVFNSGHAIFGGGAVFTLAASPWLDYIVVDSNFVTVSVRPGDVRVVQVLTAAMKPFGKPVFFEGAFEQIADPVLHREAVLLAAASGVHGMGFTNWLDRVDHATFFRDTLAGLPAAPACGPPVAILTPYRSYLAFKGAPFADEAARQLAAADPQQEALYACLDVVERAVPSLAGLQIFGMPDMLLSALQQFERVWYLEPDVLLSGDAATVARIERRAAELGVGWAKCLQRAPDFQPAVIPECCPL